MSYSSFISSAQKLPFFRAMTIDDSRAILSQLARNQDESDFYIAECAREKKITLHSQKLPIIPGVTIFEPLDTFVSSASVSSAKKELRKAGIALPDPSHIPEDSGDEGTSKKKTVKRDRTKKNAPKIEVRPKANPDDDLAERRRIQNRIAQRNYRKKHKKP